MAAKFEDYVATRSVALQRFAYLICRDVEDARDLVQDALLGLYPRWASVVAKGNPDAYVKPKHRQRGHQQVAAQRPRTPHRRRRPRRHSA
ncbi:MAG: sigma factor [Micropruina glycogenica]